MKFTLGAALAILALPMAVTAAAVPDTAESKTAAPEPAVTTVVNGSDGEEGAWPAEQINRNYTFSPGTVYVDQGTPINETEVAALASRSPQNCGIHVWWTNNWHEAGYRRYRIEASAYQGQFHATTFWMLDRWCSYFYNRAHGFGTVNAQCHVTGGNYAIGDLSSFEGSHGHWIYHQVNQEAVNAWRLWTEYNCDVHSNF